MPPRQSEGKSSSESSKKKTKSQSAYPDQRLDEISVARARVIASKLGIPNPGKHIKDTLIPLIREKMALVTACAECGGGPCAPDEHVFPASILTPAGALPAVVTSRTLPGQMIARAGNISSL